MSFIKKTLALVLILAMTFGLVLSANAAGSPEDAPETETKNPGYDVATGVDDNTATHNGNEVISKIDGTKATVLTVKATDTTAAATKVTLATARDADNNPVNVTQVGDGKNGVFDSKDGRKVTQVTIKSTKKVTLSKAALKGSKVKTIKVPSQKIAIKKDAFKGTKVKNPTIKLSGAKKASDVTVAKGAFNGLNAKAKIVVSKSMSAKEFEKLKAKLVKAGFTGKIVRK